MRTLIVLALSALALPALAADLNDPQIATVALTANDIDIARGKMALSKTKNPEVKQFAQQMVDDHGAAKQEELALAKKLGVKPQESDVTKSLKKAAADQKKELSKLSGAAFDKRYIDIEVGYHEAVIGAVKDTLIPGAKNAELKAALTNAVPTFEGHLAHAKNVQASLAGSAAK